jgi:hypothetical protein
MQATLLILVVTCAAAAAAQSPESLPATAPRSNQALVIIAPERFHAALGDFVHWKDAQRPVDLFALEDVMRHPDARGSDDAEKLKRFLYEYHRDTRFRYALLVGDADVLPVRYMALDRIDAAAHDVAFYPSDLYYGDTEKNGAFDDWNARKDGVHARYFGEVRGEKWKDDAINFDAVDYRPELAVGRWPVSTPAQVELVARKTMTFEKAVIEAQAAPASRPARAARRTVAAFLHVAGWIDARATLDAAAAKLPAAITIEKRYGGGDGAAADVSEAATARLLASGAAYVFHCGHGQGDRWDGSLGAGAIGRLANAAAPAIMMSVGCSTAHFSTLPPYEPYADEAGVEHRGTTAGSPPPPACYQKSAQAPGGLGERLLRETAGGAVAYIGCTTGGQPCGLTLLDGVCTAIGEGSATLGDAWARAIALYYDREGLASLRPTADWYPPSVFFQGMKYVLFGDPSLLLPAAASR